MDWLWGFYAGTTYEGRRVDWNGAESMAPEQHELVASAGFIPPGFFDAGQSLPLKFRKPTAPYHLVRLIVEKFTSLLFSHRRTPKLVVEGDPDTEELITAMVRVTRFWPRWIEARSFGGSMGAVGMGFHFDDGLPVLEVFDPRHCIPTRKSERGPDLQEFERRYAYQVTVKDHRGRPSQKWVWYRRVIDANDDRVWTGVPVTDGEPDWEAYDYDSTPHNFGFCPVVWVPNLSRPNSVDGWGDCHGIYDTVMTMDALLSQANKGTLANCDPTLLLSTDAEFDGIAKGSDNAMKLEKGGSGSYLEIAGSGPRLAMEMADKLEEKACRMARCYLDTNKTGGAKSVVEIERDYSSMIEKADMLREQYAELGIKPLLRMMVKAARQLMQPRIVPGVGVVRQTLDLPLRAMQEDNGGKAIFMAHRLGPSNRVDLRWPDYFTPGLDDIQKAVACMELAKRATLVDDEHALQFLQPYLQIRDVAALAAKLKQQAAEERSALESQMMNAVGSMTNEEEPGEEEETKAEDAVKALKALA